MVKSSPKTKWKKAKEYGIDISLLELNIQKSVMERIMDHQKALELVLALIESGRKYYAGLQKTDRKSDRQRS